MGQTLAKNQISKEETEETEEQQQRRLRAFHKIKNSKYIRLLGYITEKDLYAAYWPVIAGDTIRTLGYYKTFEEAEKRLDDLVLKLFGEIENEHLVN